MSSPFHLFGISSWLVSWLFLKRWFPNFGQLELYFRSSSVWLWLWFMALFWRSSFSVREWVPGANAVSFLLLFALLLAGGLVAGWWAISDRSYMPVQLGSLVEQSSRMHTYVRGQNEPRHFDGVWTPYRAVSYGDYCLSP